MCFTFTTMSLNKTHISHIAIIVGKKLRELRERDCLSQEKLSSHLSISRPTLIAYETGKQSLSVAEAYLAADYFQVEISELVPSLEDIKQLTSVDNALAQKHFDSKTLKDVQSFISEIRKDEK